MKKYYVYVREYVGHELKENTFVVYAHNVNEIKKNMNVQYAGTDVTVMIITEYWGEYVLIARKMFSSVKKSNWVKRGQTIEGVEFNINSVEPAEAESQPAKKTDKIKARYLAIEMKIKNIQGEMIDRFYLFDVSRETNKYYIMGFANSFISDSVAIAYIIEEYQKHVIMKGKKIYIPYKKTYWMRKNVVLSKTFLDDFRK